MLFMENARGKHSRYNYTSSMLCVRTYSSLDNIHEVILQQIASGWKMEASTAFKLTADIQNDLL